ncbi:hypothetical protein CF326_g4236 [Tilletia indica]|nr:hypothetical protein CF326_g4236 [Tilletia indica]
MAAYKWPLPDTWEEYMAGFDPSNVDFSNCPTNTQERAAAEAALPTPSQVALGLLHPDAQPGYRVGYAASKACYEHEDLDKRPKWVEILTPELLNRPPEEVMRAVMKQFDSWFTEVARTKGVLIRPILPSTRIYLSSDDEDAEPSRSPPRRNTHRPAIATSTTVRDSQSSESDLDSDLDDRRLYPPPSAQRMRDLPLGDPPSSQPSLTPPPPSQAPRMQDLPPGDPPSSQLSLTPPPPSQAPRHSIISRAQSREQIVDTETQSDAPSSTQESLASPPPSRSPPRSRTLRRSAAVTANHPTEPPSKKTRTRSGQTSEGFVKATARANVRGKGSTSSGSAATSSSSSSPSNRGEGSSSQGASVESMAPTVVGPGHSGSLACLSPAARHCVSGSKPELSERWVYRGLFRWGAGGLTDERPLTFADASAVKPLVSAYDRFPGLRERWECKRCKSFRHECVGHTTSLTKHVKHCWKQ